jgi:hypothetical protein
MIVTALIGILIFAVLGTYTMVDRGLAAIRNYNALHKEGRNAVDIFSRDVRNAFSVSAASATSVTLIQPRGTNAFQYPGGTLDSSKMRTVRYFLNSQSLMQTDSWTGETTTLTTNVHTLTFSTYNSAGSLTTTLANIKEFQIDLVLRKRTIGTFQTEDYLSARWVMRNKNARR